MTDSNLIVLVGDGGVGKTCFLKTIMNDTFEKSYNASQSFFLRPQEVEYKNVRYTILDTAGQEINQPLSSDADIYFVMFDLTNTLSYKNARRWIEKIKSVNLTARLLLIGTKSDSSSRKLCHRDVHLQKEYSIPYVEISSKNKVVDEVFSFM